MSTKRAQMAQEPPGGPTRDLGHCSAPYRHLSDELSGPSVDVAGRAEATKARVTVLQGDARQVLKTLAAQSVHCCVTSPPYWGLRSYLPDGHPDKAAEIGAEQTPGEYVAALVAVFREVWRVLRDDGTLWLNLASSFAGSWGNYAPGGIKGVQRERTEDGQRWERRAYDDTTRKPATAEVPGYKSKDMIPIPWLVGIALQQDGWYLRMDCIWHKGSAMPESVTDRPTKSHEYMLLLAKSERYYYDAAAVAEPAVSGGRRVYPSWEERKATGAAIRRGDPGQSGDVNHGQGVGGNGSTRNRRSVWSINPAPTRLNHYAAYPPALVAPCVLASTSAMGCCPACLAPWRRVVEKVRLMPAAPSGNREVERWDAAPQGSLGGRTATQDWGWEPSCSCGHPLEEAVPCTVLDPFSGSGTTLQVALNLGRSAVGIELSPEYCALIDKRIGEAITPPLFPIGGEEVQA